MRTPTKIPDTPFYLYDMQLLRRTITAAKQAAIQRPDFNIHYAVKANPLPEILRAMAQAGFGADTVSGGEIIRAIDAGIPASKIVFAGVGKTDAEIKLALEKGVAMLNAESQEELEIIASIARDMGKIAPVSLRINPDIDAHTHRFITTGLQENKFGIDKTIAIDVVKSVVDNPWLDFRGLHFHIGSQITTMEPYRVLCERALKLVKHLEEISIDVPELNFGGGLGVDYDSPGQNPVPAFDEYFGVFARLLPRVQGRRYHFEPGRSLTAQCGSLITRVLYVKKGLSRKFAIVDAGMTELIRPALYGAHHSIENLSAHPASPCANYDVVGPVCESADVFATNITLPITHRGDVLAIRSAGAYGQTMSSNYNCRSLRPAVFME